MNKSFKLVLHQRALAMRKNPTPAEKLLWSKLKSAQLGITFRRQHMIGPYIVDFVSLNIRIIIECDGESHGHKKESDEQRDLFLSAQGFQVLRFWNNEIMSNIEGCLSVIHAHVLKHYGCTPP